jgi:hypothetical protein
MFECYTVLVYQHKPLINLWKSNRLAESFKDFELAESGWVRY